MLLLLANTRIRQPAFVVIYKKWRRLWWLSATVSFYAMLME
jgi:hypothetical protein